MGVLPIFELNSFCTFVLCLAPFGSHAYLVSFHSLQSYHANIDHAALALLKPQNTSY